MVRYSVRFIVLAMVCFQLTLCGMMDKGDDKKPKDVDPRFVADMRDSAWDMYRLLNPITNFKSFVFSPLSIQHVLGMLLAGARRNTKFELLGALKMHDANYSIFKQFELATMKYFEGLENVTYPTKLGNRIYLAEGFEPRRNFERILNNSFAASHDTINVSNPDEARNKIDEWVSEITDGMITNIAEGIRITVLTKLVLANAMSFDAKWKGKFEEIEEGMSWYTGTEDITINAMKTEEEFYFIDESGAEQSGMQYFAIPYKNANIDVYFVIAVPKRRYPEALKGFDTLLSSSLIKDYLPVLGTEDQGKYWTRNFPMDKLMLPPFTMDAKVDAVRMLNDLGVKDVFDEGRSDLSGIIKFPTLSVTSFEHAANINVNVNGTRAAGATVAVTGARTFGFSQTYKVDQGFFFGIYQDGNFIMMGNYLDPKPKV